MLILLVMFVAQSSSVILTGEYVGPNFIANTKGLINLILEGNPCISFNSPAEFQAFTATFSSNCQGPIIPDVETRGLKPTHEEYKTLTAASVDLKIKNKYLTDELTITNARLKNFEKMFVTTNNTL